MDLEGRQTDSGPCRERGLHWKLHQFPHFRSARRGLRFEGPQSEPERARSGGPRLSGGQASSRSGRPLPDIFRAAGCEWREPGCSMCIAMNGDMLQPGEYSVSTSNRNFEGRQGKGGRTFLASPLTAAASAVMGRSHGCSEDDVKAFVSVPRPPGSLPDQQHRYGPDHSRALPENHFERGPG